MTALWTLVLAAAGVGLAGALALWVCPKRWIVDSDVAAKLYRHAGPPPWRVLNRLGKIATLALYGGTCLMVCVLIVGILLQKSAG